jgi:hypothetical protein
MKDRRKGITANEDSIIFEIKIKKECLNTYFKLDSDKYSAFPNENEILLQDGCPYYLGEITEKQFCIH